ncbi:electron transfer flavoprotein [Thermoplasma volcanium GSS1]|uniref:Electron transfer flavoprotein n=1 Tax=Thermoplasma volcanium (strain ATCC 51530 / DSM 4299 / JCM 9571 / NBRC 15438 / GSS1) TaxID=273116 RepID=Q978W4_THEVO|nr:FAD-dependent oxidoreductase [Thermoplasma volcanium]BAB60443.1 electron transfer flavoprotein [Thermoplasma volcanium GSS1]
MSEFDVAVIGAGPAGSSAAIRLAQNGMNVLLVERGDPPGTKNVSGAVLWGNELAKVVPDWERSAPVERYVTRKEVAFLTEKSKIAISFSSEELQNSKSGKIIVRGKFDQWLAKKAKDAGAMLVTGVTVDRLAIDNGKVIGIQQDNDVITADAVVVAEGANPRVLINSGLRPKLSDRDVALGIKETIKLPENVINERFNVDSKSGFASEFVLGFLDDGLLSGGFLYTNKDTVSLGIVASLDRLRANGVTHSYDIMGKFEEHPFIKNLIKDGIPDEYAAHLVPEGGISSMPKLYGNGYLVAGDAAAFTFSNGMVLQGINYAITSGILAADTIIENRNNINENTLAKYVDKLRESYVLSDLYNFNGIQNVTWSDFVQKSLPTLAESVMMSLFDEKGMPKKHLRQIVTDAMKSGHMKYSDLITNGYRVIKRM